MTAISSEPTRRVFIAGALWGLLMATMGAGWIVFSRMGVTTSLTPYDLVAFRFGIGGLLFLPLLIRTPPSAEERAPIPILLMAIGAGIPYTMAAIVGLNYAPVGHASALLPGTLPLIAALLSVLFLKEKLFPGQYLGHAFILIGAGAVGGLTLFEGIGQQTVGHVLFLTASLCWAIYTVTLRRCGMHPVRAAAIVSVISAIVYAPLYLGFLESGIRQAPFWEIVFHALFQGVCSGVIMLIAFNRTIALLGSARGSVCVSLVPVMATIAAIPILGEFPTMLVWFGVIAVTIGAFLASGAYRAGR